MDKKASSSHRALQWVGIILVFLSSLPCALTFFNIPSVIQYAIETRNNASLQLFIPLGIASCLAGLGWVLLLVSFLIQSKKKQNLSVEEQT